MQGLSHLPYLINEVGYTSSHLIPHGHCHCINPLDSLVFKVLPVVRVRSNVDGILREDYPLIDMLDNLSTSINQLFLLYELAIVVDEVLVVLYHVLVL